MNLGQGDFILVLVNLVTAKVVGVARVKARGF